MGEKYNSGCQLADDDSFPLFFKPGLIAKYGYPVEVHNVVTSDGYILELHRIPHSRDDKPGDRPAVLLMHGLLSSSADFLIMGPGNALGKYLHQIVYLG